MKVLKNNKTGQIKFWRQALVDVGIKHSEKGKWEELEVPSCMKNKETGMVCPWCPEISTSTEWEPIEPEVKPISPAPLWKKDEVAALAGGPGASNSEVQALREQLAEMKAQVAQLSATAPQSLASDDPSKASSKPGK